MQASAGIRQTVKVQRAAVMLVLYDSLQPAHQRNLESLWQASLLLTGTSSMGRGRTPTLWHAGVRQSLKGQAAAGVMMLYNSLQPALV